MLPATSADPPILTCGVAPDSRTTSDWRRVRAALAYEQISHLEIARAAGVSEQTVCRYLNGRRLPGERAAHRIIHALRTMGVLDDLS